MKTRRQFWHDLAAAACALGAHASGQAAQAPRPVKFQPDVIIHAGTYPGWPWLTAGADGTLYCAFREGTVHGYSAVGQALFSQSRDNGKTWSKAEVIVDAPEIDDRNVAIVELPNKELLVTYNTYTKDRVSLAMTIRSGAGGRSWGKPRPVGELNTRTRSAAYPLADGTLLLPYYLAPGNGALAALSRDNGATWKTVRVPDAEGFIGDEWDVLEVEGGRLIGILRNSNVKGNGIFWKTESRDAGRTWAAPRPTNVQSRRHASPAQIVRQGRTPTLIYADRRMVSVSAVPTTDPAFLRWDLDRRWPCYVYNRDESPILDSSYPVSAPVGPSQRLIVDYEIRKESRRIAGYFVTFPEKWCLDIQSTKRFMGTPAPLSQFFSSAHSPRPRRSRWPGSRPARSCHPACQWGRKANR